MIRPSFAAAILSAMLLPAAEAHADGSSPDGGLRDADARGTEFCDPGNPPARPGADLESRIKALLDIPLLKNASVSIDTLNLRTGVRGVSISPEKMLNPASVTKIATSAAALDLLGPYYQFSTDILVDKDPADGLVEGGIYFRGHGDPRLTSEKIFLMVTELKQLGLKKVTGDIVIDDTLFDDERMPRGWEKVRTEGAYHAGTGALSVNFNSVAVKCLPSETGKEAIVTLEPPIAYFKLVNKLRTAAGGKRKIEVEIKPKDGGEEIEVKGTIPPDNEGKTYYRRISNPPVYAAALIRRTFEMQGIAVAGKTRVAAVPETALPFHTFLSDRLAVIVRDMNKSSNNFTAEQVLKVLGGSVKLPASFDDGLAVASTFLEKAGIPKGSYTMTNGSGLSHQTRFSSEQLVKILAYAWRQFKWGADFFSSMSIAAGDGTIRKRYKGTGMAYVLRAKTGTIDGVSSIAGYLQNASGDPVAFSIVINGFNPKKFRDVTNVEDAITNAIGETK